MSGGEPKASVVWLFADRAKFRVISAVLKKTCILQDVVPCRWIRWHFTTLRGVASGFVENDRSSVKAE